MRDWFKQQTKKTIEQYGKVDSIDKLVDDYLAAGSSKSQPRVIGNSSEGKFYLYEEDLDSHMHILGATQEGKSKLFELLIRQNINREQGCLLIDPSENGSTCYKVLNYAVEKGFEKILLIDPHDVIRKKRVPVINPIRYDNAASAVSGNFMDSTRLLWGNRYEDTPRIEKYLPAIIRALHAGKFTLADMECLLDSRDPAFKNQRLQILGNSDFVHYNRIHYAHLATVFGIGVKQNQREYEGFTPTINRVMPFMDETLKLIFGMRAGIDFHKLIREKYVILVNLDTGGLWGAHGSEQRLLGTIIINEFLSAISSMRANNWKGRFQIFIDEAADYATPKVTEILDKKAKSGVRLYLAHQGFDQFTREVEGSVRRGTKLKVLFHTADPQDSSKMLAMMYSFTKELPESQVKQFVAALKKGHAIFKVGKTAPKAVEVKHIPDIKNEPAVVQAFKDKLYRTDWYRSIDEIRAERTQRFAIRSPKAATSKTPVPNQPEPATSSEPAPSNQPAAAPGVELDLTSSSPSTAQSRRSPIFDNLPSSTTLLRDEGGRPTRKRSSRKTKGT